MVILTRDSRELKHYLFSTHVRMATSCLFKNGLNILALALIRDVSYYIKNLVKIWYVS